MPVKATRGTIVQAVKTVKARDQPPPMKPICDEMVQKCLIYLFNNHKYYLEKF